MFLLLDTSNQTCHLTVIFDDKKFTHSWESGRDLARHLLKFIIETLQIYDKTLQDVTGLGVLRGPGGFTGLRIGIITMNVLSASLKVPIAGSVGQDWQNEVTHKLKNGQNEEIILPEYGRPPRITAPRK